MNTNEKDNCLDEVTDSQPLDLDKAIETAIKAAEGGDSVPALDLGVALLLGKEPFSTDEKKAVEMFKYAAKAGSVAAMDNLGLCYSNGYGVEADKELAIEWLPKRDQKTQWVCFKIYIVILTTVHLSILIW